MEKIAFRQNMSNSEMMTFDVYIIFMSNISIDKKENQTRQIDKLTEALLESGYKIVIDDRDDVKIRDKANEIKLFNIPFLFWVDDSGDYHLGTPKMRIRGLTPTEIIQSMKEYTDKYKIRMMINGQLKGEE